MSPTAATPAVFNPLPAVEIKVLDSRLVEWGLPRYQSEMAAAVDLFACLEASLKVRAGAAAELIPSGLALHMNDPHLAALILPRSGLGHKRGLVMGNLVGLCDADYTGQVMISVWNRNAPGTPDIVIEPGDRIAQMMFVPVVRPSFELVTEFSADSVRGTGGFGSSGIAHSKG